MDYLNKRFEILAPITKKLEEDGELYIEGMASTNAVDRVGDIIAREAWEHGGLDNFKNNPIVLFNHDADQPIGTATEVEVVDNGLRIKARISKAAGKIYELIKDGVLGAFSVSFLIKDAEYIEETYGLLIKDAELLENSVVSVPCNQTATFSLAKSFESLKEYEDFKKTFVDPAGLDNGKKEEKSSKTKTTPAGVPKGAQKEIKMDEATKLAMEELAAKVAKETADSIKLQLDLDAAKAKAQREADEKAAQEAVEKAANITAREGAEKLIEDLEAKLAEKDVDMAATLSQFKTDLEDKAKELEDMRNSKGTFKDRKSTESAQDFIKKNGKDLMYAHMLGVMTNKGWTTKYGSEMLEKAGIEYVTYAGDLDQEIQDNIQKEITVHTKVAQLFRDIPVNGASTVLPIQGDTNMAVWQATATEDANLVFTGNLENNPQLTAATYEAQQVIMNVFRLISSSYIDNDTDEQVLINLMPMLVDGVARAHARAVENMLLNDATSISGLTTHATAWSGTPPTAVGGLAAADLLSMRTDMGKYGLNPADVVYIVNQDTYYALLGDVEFENINEVGSLATKITGMVGMVYGTPVIVSDEFPTSATGTDAAFCVHTASYVMPRLRNMKVEQDYEVGKQRRIIVATQSLGFTELFAAAPASVVIVYGTIA